MHFSVDAFTDLQIPTLLTLSAAWNGYTLLSVPRPSLKRTAESRCSVVFLSVVKYFTVKVVEHPLNMTSFSIPT